MTQIIDSGRRFQLVLSGSLPAGFPDAPGAVEQFVSANISVGAALLPFVNNIVVGTHNLSPDDIKRALDKAGSPLRKV